MSFPTRKPDWQLPQHSPSHPWEGVIWTSFSANAWTSTIIVLEYVRQLIWCCRQSVYICFWQGGQALKRLRNLVIPLPKPWPCLVANRLLSWHYQLPTYYTWGICAEAAFPFLILFLHGRPAKLQRGAIPGYGLSSKIKHLIFAGQPLDTTDSSFLLVLFSQVYFNLAFYCCLQRINIIIMEKWDFLQAATYAPVCLVMVDSMASAFAPLTTSTFSPPTK